MTTAMLILYVPVRSRRGVIDRHTHHVARSKLKSDDLDVSSSPDLSAVVTVVLAATARRKG
jgi:hypothetical protein